MERSIDYEKDRFNRPALDYGQISALSKDGCD